MVQRFYLLILILLSMLQLKSVQAQTYAIQEFRRAVQTFEVADRQYQAAASGSFEERMADQQRRSASDHAKYTIQQYDAFLNLSSSENERLFLEFNQSYQAAASGSLRESIYDVARRAGAEGLKNNASRELQYAYDYQESLRLTLQAEQRYQAAASGSLIESVYNAVRVAGYDISKQKLRDFSNQRVYEFREAERLFVQFSSQYQAAASGSRVEDFYNFGRQLMSARTLEIFRSQVYRYSYSELSSIQAEYHSKYQSAASGSMSESLYRSIRDEARARMGAAPNPYPTPYPQPGSRCEVKEGRNASGQVFYRVIDQAGRILFTGGYREAFQFSQSDSRCRR